jgi:predicted aspartyl protease
MRLRRNSAKRTAAPWGLLAAVLLVGGLGSTGAVLAAEPEQAAAPPPPQDVLEEVVIRAPEPRYVAPTRRDRIGRVWVLVLINGKGPFRLVLDSGATRTAILPGVAERLGIPTDRSPPVILRGVTGSITAPTVKAESLEVGDLYIAPTTLPIVADAFGGAEGLLGTEGLSDKRIYIDFRHDFINISRSKELPAEPGFITVPTLRRTDRLLLVNATVGGVRATAIIDTGAQATVANGALRTALERQLRSQTPTLDEITGATGDTQTGEGRMVSRILIGRVQIQSAHITFGDMQIFRQWRLLEEPALLVGMDILGLVDTLVIDYKRHELMVRLRADAASGRSNANERISH